MEVKDREIADYKARSKVTDREMADLQERTQTLQANFEDLIDCLIAVSVFDSSFCTH